MLNAQDFIKNNQTFFENLQKDIIKSKVKPFTDSESSLLKLIAQSIFRQFGVATQNGRILEEVCKKVFLDWRNTPKNSHHEVGITISWRLLEGSSSRLYGTTNDRLVLNYAEINYGFGKSNFSEFKKYLDKVLEQDSCVLN